MREPIKPEDIRKGDLIRYERGAHYVHADVAHEYVARSDGDRAGYGESTYYLLDRPHAAVDLPDEPTLGWVEGIDLRRQFGAWVTSGTQETLYAMRQSDWATSEVTSFVEAVAVPKAALDELREYREGLRLTAGIEMHPTPAVRRIDTFLAAIDAANGDPR